MRDTQPDFQSNEFLLDHYVGKTPLVRLQRLASHTDRKSTRLNSSHLKLSRMPSSA